MSVPVSFEVDDIRTVKERIKTEEHICELSVPNNFGGYYNYEK